MRQLGDAVDGPVVPRAEPTAMATPPPAGGRPVLTRKTSITSPGATRVALLRRESIQSVELESIQRAVAPQLEGRIVVLDAQVRCVCVRVCVCACVGHMGVGAFVSVFVT